MLRFFALCFSFILYFTVVKAQTNTLSVSEKPAAFALFTSSSTATIYTDSNDAKVVTIAATAFANDVQLISGKPMEVTHQIPSNNFTIIAGTIGQSKIIDQLIKDKQLDVSKIKSNWETFTIQIIKASNTQQSAKLPFRGGGAYGTTLIIAGSDRRGTTFGIFHLSKLMGVSPLVWWADVLPEKKQQLFVSGSYTSATPSVKYRGIFINDEDWGMQPWAAKNMDTDIKDIGPKTYAKIFELLLRLKANYIWPAMHPCTKAFYYYKDNPKVADDYAIVVGGSHCEPMLRNNVCEWAETYEEEYGTKPGEWRYDVNKEEIYKYWDDRIKQAVNYESVFTVGMRGVHDGSMPGPKDPNEKVKLLEKVITDQREILQKNFKQSPEKLPQIFVPYKEVLSLYQRGMKLPDDVTIIWPDDNYGYIRQLPNAAEQKRSGGNGVYYHLSYWGSPADYLWLSSTSPALIGYEMKKAYDYGAKKLWVFNVGDLKPAELETQFALDMAYDINVYNEKSPEIYIQNWATETFGKANADTITAIKKMYYQLAQSGKPEHLNTLTFTSKEMGKRIDAYDKIGDMADRLQDRIDKRLSDAFYQLVEYPVSGARYMNNKIFENKFASISLGEEGAFANYHADLAELSYEYIQKLTEYYNKRADGKWNGMMSWHPRDQKVFNAPTPLDSLKTTTDSALVKKEIKEKQLLHVITARQLYDGGFTKDCKLLPGLGISGAGLVANVGLGAITYNQLLSAGKYTIVIKCLPTFAMEKQKQLNYTIAINDEAAQNANVNADAETSVWKENVLRGFSQGATKHVVLKNGAAIISIGLQNKNLVISQIEIYKN